MSNNWRTVLSWVPVNSTELLKKFIELLRNNGVEINSPYDVDNWIEDNISHSKMFETGLFQQDV